MRGLNEQTAKAVTIYQALAHPCAFGGKVRFKKRIHAQSEATRLNKTRIFPTRATAYECPGCGFWHVGRKVK